MDNLIHSSSGHNSPAGVLFAFWDLSMAARPVCFPAGAVELTLAPCSHGEGYAQTSQELLSRHFNHAFIH